MEDYPGDPGFLPSNLGVQESYQEIQDFPTFLARSSGIQKSWQKIENFPGSQMLGMVQSWSCKFMWENWLPSGFLQIQSMENQKSINENRIVVMGCLVGCLLETIQLANLQDCPYALYDSVVFWQSVFLMCGILTSVTLTCGMLTV